MTIVFYIVGVVVAAVIWNTTTAFQQGQRGSSPLMLQGPQPRAGVAPSFSAVIGPQMDNESITEAAYHQQSSQYEPPFDSGGESLG